MLDIHIKTIPHKEQRYPTCGDYWQNADGSLEVRISELNEPAYESLIAIHELIEQLLTAQLGISEAEITAFDQKFEQQRKPGNTDEPGDDPQSPYRQQHLFATGIEKLVAAALGIDWTKYEDIINRL
jgi:hypothetical protein